VDFEKLMVARAVVEDDNIRSMVRARHLKVICATTFPEDLVIEGE
jgi:hypothetical protein